MRRIALWGLAFAVVAALGFAGGAGLHYGHGRLLAETIIHYPTGDYIESGEWERIILTRSTAYPRHYFDVTTFWHSSNLDPNPHQSSHNCNVFSPAEIYAQLQ